MVSLTDSGDAGATGRRPHGSRTLLFLALAGLSLGRGLRGEALASDACVDSSMGFAVYRDVRRIEGDGAIEQQMDWPIQATLSIDTAPTLYLDDVGGDHLPKTFRLGEVAP